LIVDAGEPGLIGWACMRERDGSDEEKGKQHGTQAIGTRGIQAVENNHSRLVKRWSVVGWADGTIGLATSVVNTILTK
jgi:hypothetical protein